MSFIRLALPHSFAGQPQPPTARKQQGKTRGDCEPPQGQPQPTHHPRRAARTQYRDSKSDEVHSTITPHCLELSSRRPCVQIQLPTHSLHWAPDDCAGRYNCLRIHCAGLQTTVRADTTASALLELGSRRRCVQIQLPTHSFICGGKAQTAIIGRGGGSNHHHKTGYSTARVVLIVKMMSGGCVSRINRWRQCRHSCNHSLNLRLSAWLHHFWSHSCYDNLSPYNVRGHLIRGASAHLHWFDNPC